VRLLALCDDPPDASAGTGNGSTMIAAHVLPRLAPDTELVLAYFDDGRRRLDAAVAARCSAVLSLPLRSRAASLPAAVLSRRPRATWRREHPRALALALPAARRADALYVHGLHAFGLALALRRHVRLPLVVNEVDDWAEHWRRRAGTRRGPARWYDLGQSTRARALERETSAVADGYVVVAPADAARLTAALGRPVRAVPNGVSVSRPAAAHEPDGDALGFLGSLDYPPNVEAVTLLATRVLPRVRAQHPAARLVVAGRHPGPAVHRLAGPAVAVLGEVEDPGAFYRSVAVMVYPGTGGTGAKNTVAEALAAGAAVVASPVAARELPDAGQLVLADSPEAVAEKVVELLREPARRAALQQRARSFAAGLPTWDATARTYSELLRAALARA
jgi:glycosyltransferase involved in cell wall biosynthesis